MEEESRERCPNCGSSNIAKIIWGLPDFTEELQKRIDAGEIVLGGCIPGKGFPASRCICTAPDPFPILPCGITFHSFFRLLNIA